MSASFKPLPAKIRAELFHSLSALERAGLPADKAFSHVHLPKPAQQRVENTVTQLQRGKDIPTAGAAAGLFNDLETQLLKVAVSAGSPATTYKQLADRYTLEAKIQNNMRSRLMLPGLIFVLSIFLSVLPPLVSGSMSIATALWQFALPLLTIAGIYYFAKTIRATMSNLTDALLLKLPIFGVLHRRINLKDYFESLAIMLEAGLPMFDALAKANNSLHNHLIRVQFKRVGYRVKQGKTLTQALEPALNQHAAEEARVIELINTGEASGTLPEMLWRHVNDESNAIAHNLEQLAAWIPRVIYGIVAMRVAYSILTSGAFMPKVG